MPRAIDDLRCHSRFHDRPTIRVSRGSAIDSANGPVRIQTSQRILEQVLDHALPSELAGDLTQTCLVEAVRYEGEPPPIGVYDPPEMVALPAATEPHASRG